MPDMLPIAEWGDATTPFRIATREPILYTPGRSFSADRLWEYADGHPGFYGWLRVVNRRIERLAIVGLMDLPDRCWRDEYDDQVRPHEAADRAIDEMAEEFGIDPR